MLMVGLLLAVAFGEPRSAPRVAVPPAPRPWWAGPGTGAPGPASAAGAGLGAPALPSADALRRRLQHVVSGFPYPRAAHRPTRHWAGARYQARRRLHRPRAGARHAAGGGLRAGRWLLSPTDAVAVSAIARRVGLPRRVVAILEGESLVNDASALVAYRFAVAAACAGAFSVGQASFAFVWVLVAGIVVGLAGGFVILQLTKFIGDPLDPHSLLPGVSLPGVAAGGGHRRLRRPRRGDGRAFRRLPRAHGVAGRRAPARLCRVGNLGACRCWRLPSPSPWW